MPVQQGQLYMDPEGLRGIELLPGGRWWRGLLPDLVPGRDAGGVVLDDPDLVCGPGLQGPCRVTLVAQPHGELLPWVPLEQADFGASALISAE